MALKWDTGMGKRRVFKPRLRGLMALLAIIIAMVLAVAIGLKACKRGGPLPEPSPSPTPQPTPHTLVTDPPVVAVSPTVEPTQRPQDAGYADYTGGGQVITTDESYMRDADVDGQEMVFTAGSGLLSGKIMTKLYLANLTDATARLVATCAMEDGEIFSPRLTKKYIAWVESDHAKNNVVRFYNRSTQQITEVCRVPGGIPTLALAGDRLAVQARTGENQDTVTCYDLVTGASDIWATYTQGEYRAGAIWACGDSIAISMPVLDAQGQDSGASQVVVKQQLGQDDIIYSIGFYAHAPRLGNGAIAFLNRATSDDASLYVMLEDGAPIWVERGVAGYAIGDGFVIYGKQNAIWCYNYLTGEYARLMPGGTRGRLPVAGGRYAVWQEWKDTGKNGLVYKKLELIAG
nr:hypothetical protein [bacterium]